MAKFWSTKLFNFLVFGLLLFSAVAARGATGDKCLTDKDCDADHLFCVANVCQHRDLFPIRESDIWALVVMIALAMFAILFGLSGGTLIVPLAIILIDFSPKEAAGLANSIVVMTSLTKYLLGLFKKNPKVPFKTIVDYNAIIAMSPLLMLFSAVGGIVGLVMPEAIILGMFLICVIFSISCTAYQIRVQRRRETIGPHSIKTGDYAQVADLPSGQVDATERERLIVEQKNIEGRNFYLPKFGVLVFIILFSILAGLLKGGDGFASIAGIKKCTAGEWAVLCCFGLGLFGATLYSSHVIFKEQGLKRKIGWDLDPAEIHFTKKTFIIAVLWSMFSGMMATITGLGGSTLLTPLFWWLTYQPVTAAWTINLSSLMSKLAAVIVLFLAGKVKFDYVGVFGFAIAVSIVVAENTLLVFIKKTKSQLIMPIGLLLIQIIIVVASAYVTFNHVHDILDKGQSLWEFGDYC